LSASFDTFADAAALSTLQTTLQALAPNDVVFMVAYDSATGGPTGTTLPDDLVSTLKTYGAVHAGDIRLRTPYIFISRIGSDVRIERFSQTEGVIRIELTPQEVAALFPGTESALKTLE
jgi:hypothetical protein